MTYREDDQVVRLEAKITALEKRVSAHERSRIPLWPRWLSATFGCACVLGIGVELQSNGMMLTSGIIGGITLAVALAQAINGAAR